MTAFRSPALSFSESPNRPVAPDSDNEASTALLAITEKGPFVPTPCRSPEEFNRIFGSFLDAAEAAFWMDVYWTNAEGSGEVWVQRLGHYTDPSDPSTLTAIKASTTLLDGGPGYSLSGTTPATTVTAPAVNFRINLSGDGVQAIALNAPLAGLAAIAADIQSEVRALIAVTPANQPDFDNFTCVVTSDGRLLLRNGTIAAGKTVVVTNGLVDDVAASLDLGVANGGTEAGPFVSTLLVEALSEGVHGNELATSILAQNLVNTVTAALLTNGDTSLDLESIGGVVPGSILEITDITAPLTDPNPFYVEVERIENGLVILTEAVVLTETVQAGATVRSIEFILTVRSGGVELERHAGLSMNTRNTSQYVETIVNDEFSGSVYIRVTDLSSVSPVPLNAPADVTDQALTGGDDGLTGLDENDLIGDATARTGMQAFRDVETINSFALPETLGRDADVQQAVLFLAEEIQRFQVCLDPPVGLDVDGVIDYVTDTLRSSSDYGDIGWPNHKMKDPRNRALTRVVSRSAANLGLRARMAGTTNEGVWLPPGGPQRPYKGIVGLEDEATLIETNRDRLYEKRINPETSFRNGTGIFTFGVQTLSRPGVVSGTTVGTGEIQKRATFLKVRRDFTGFCRSKLISSVLNLELVREMTASCTAYLRNLRARGGLTGATDEEAFYVKFVPDFERGILAGRVGLALNKALEFITFDLFEMRPPVTGDLTE